MKLLVDGTEVSVKYLPFEEPVGGAVLQLLLHESAGRDALHKELVQEHGSFSKIPVMDHAEAVDGCTEIRFLGATQLEIIDLVRMLGHGVREINPHQ